MSTARYPAGSNGKYTATLRNADGTVIPYDSLGAATPRVTAVTLQLTDEYSGDTVNSRSGNDHFNTNNVTVDSSGVLTWEVQAADTAIHNTSLSPLPSAEEHTAVFTVTYIDADGDTKTLIHEHILDCRGSLALCRFEDVQLQLPGIETTDRQFIEEIIDSVSLRCEAYCQRKFITATETEYFSIDRLQDTIRVQRYPISSITGVWEDYTAEFSGDIFQTVAANYEWDKVGRGTKGLIRCKYRPWTKGIGSVKVTYTGGLGRSVGALPADLRQSVARQAAYLYQRRTSLGISGESIGGGSVSLMSEPDLLPDVKKVWATYKRKDLP